MGLEDDKLLPSEDQDLAETIQRLMAVEEERKKLIKEVRFLDDGRYWSDAEKAYHPPRHTPERDPKEVPLYA